VECVLALRAKVVEKRAWIAQYSLLSGQIVVIQDSRGNSLFSVLKHWFYNLFFVRWHVQDTKTIKVKTLRFLARNTSRKI